MSSTKMLMPLIILAGCFLVGMNQDKKPVQEADSLSPRELVINYAKTRMDLAQVEFDWANELSQSGTLPLAKTKLERRRSELAVAKEQFNQALTASSGGLERVRLCHAEEKVRLSKFDFEAAKKLRAKGELSDYGLDRLNLKYQLAQLGLALRKNPENYVTLMEAMQAQIDQMGQEMLALDLRITALERVNK